MIRLAAVLAAAVLAAGPHRGADADPEYLDWGPGRNWETAIARELPAYVDSRYRTIASRAGRALVGLSAGGYGAVLLAIHHLQTFWNAHAMQWLALALAHLAPAH